MEVCPSADDESAGSSTEHGVYEDARLRGERGDFSGSFWRSVLFKP